MMSQYLDTGDGLRKFFEILKQSVCCSICMEKFIDPVSLPCCHAFCSACIIEYIKNNPKCPLCKVVIPVDDVISDINVSKWSEGIWKMLRSFDDIPSFQRQNNFTISNNHSSLISIRDSEKITDSVQVHVSSSAALFHVGDLVQIVPRTWPGINKPGGVGWVIKRNESTDFSGGSRDVGGNVNANSLDNYDVKYIIDGHIDTNIPAMFISASEVDLLADNSSSSAVGRTSGRKRANRIESTPVSSGSKRRSCSPRGDSLHRTPPVSGAAVSSNSSAVYTGPVLTNDMVVVSTGLNARDREMFVTFHNMFRDTIKFSDKLDADTGVVVISGCATDHLVVEKRTMKYMNAIIRGVWILSAEWVGMCVRCKQIILHDRVELDGAAYVVEDFEIEKDVKAVCSSVCKRSRLDTTYRVLPLGAGSPSLSGRVSTNLVGASTNGVFLYGQFPHPKPTKMELTGLLESCGAVCLSSMTDIVKYCLTNNTASSRYLSSSKLVVLCTATLHGEEFVALQREFYDSLTALIHSAIKRNKNSSTDSNSNSKSKPSNLSKSYLKCVCFTSYTWLLDCISNYSVMSLLE